MKVYLSGPISSLPLEVARTCFDFWEQRIVIDGHEPINPMKLPHQHPDVWGHYMREDIKALMDCDAILLLPGWQNSSGAKIEQFLAGVALLKIYTLSPYEDFEPWQSSIAHHVFDERPIDQKQESPFSRDGVLAKQALFETKQINENELKLLGFELKQKYKHDQYHTNRYAKGVLEVEFTYEGDKLLSCDLTISDMNCKPVTLDEIKALSPILGAVEADT